MQGASTSRPLGVSLGLPRFDVLAQPELATAAVRHQDRGREVCEPTAIGRHAPSIGQADDRRNGCGVEDIVQVHSAAHRHGMVVALERQAIYCRFRTTTSGPGAAATARGLATTEVPAMTTVDPTRLRSGGVR